MQSVDVSYAQAAATYAAHGRRQKHLVASCQGRDARTQHSNTVLYLNHEIIDLRSDLLQ